MKKAIRIFAGVISVLAVPGLLLAHHSGSAYQTKPIWVEGAVVSFQFSNPHTFTTIEAQRDDGRVQYWVVEGPPMARLNLVPADFYVPQVGDVIQFCAFPYKSIDELQRLWPDVDYSNREIFRIRESDETVTQTVNGHIVLTPDGQKQAWEPHGVIAECIRSSGDTRQSWVDFLNDHSIQQWCQQRQYAIVQQDPTLAAFVEEFNAELDNPCV